MGRDVTTRHRARQRILCNRFCMGIINCPHVNSRQKKGIFFWIWKRTTLASMSVVACSSELGWCEWTSSRFLQLGCARYLNVRKDSSHTPPSNQSRLGQDVPFVLSELLKGVSCDTIDFCLMKEVLQVWTGAEKRNLSHRRHTSLGLR
jgi:hypothetical protein